MSLIVVSPLTRIAEMAVRHQCRDMLSLMADGHDFHRPGLIRPDRHKTIRLNDIAAAAEGLVEPAEVHVEAILDVARAWQRERPLLVHCWMGVSRSPAAALLVALDVAPDQDDRALVQRLRAASPFATPNPRLIEIGDARLKRGGRLIAAVKQIGRGADADGDTPFVFSAVPL